MHDDNFSDLVLHFAKGIKILAIIPSASCSAKRPFSLLRDIGTYLCSTMESKPLLKALAQPARFATIIQKTGLISYCMKIQNTVNSSGQLALSMPVVQEPLISGAIIFSSCS